MRLRKEDLVSKDVSDIDLLRELERRGRLKTERRHVDVPNGTETWVRYLSGWLVEGEDADQVGEPG